jgi:hypothetical protein
MFAMGAFERPEGRPIRVAVVAALVVETVAADFFKATLPAKLLKAKRLTDGPGLRASESFLTLSPSAGALSVERVA